MSCPRAKKERSETKDERQMQPEDDAWTPGRHKKKKKKKYDCEIQQRYTGPIDNVMSEIWGGAKGEWIRERKSIRKDAEKIIQSLRNSHMAKYFEYRIFDYNQDK